MNFRIGAGFDVHRIKTGDSVNLGGVKIPAPFSLLGHSDADVLLHAITDAVLGAIAAGDIGTHFPDTSEQNKDRDSADFLKFALELAARKGYSLGNLDSVIICEKPKISPFKNDITKRLAALINTDEKNISVKATTTEGLGFTGRGEGIAAKAVVLLVKNGGK